MLRKPLSWSVKQVCTMIQKGSITFDNPLQRPADQWKVEDKSLLIDSLFRLFIPDIYALQTKGEKGNTYDIIDGKQRLTSISSFLADEFALTELKPIHLESTGEKFDISGKKFSELPEEVQDEIKGYTITFKAIELEDDDDEEEVIEEIFYRLNNGKPMSREHLALVSAKRNVQEFVRKVITEHPLFTDNMTNFSASAVKKSDREMTILQSIMLVSGKEFSSFAAKDIEKFFIENDITAEVLDLTEKSFSSMVKCFNEYNKFLMKINIPIMAYVFANTKDEVKTSELLLNYTKNIKRGDKYKVYTGAGSVKKEKVLGRVKALSEICGLNSQEESENVAK